MLIVLSPLFVQLVHTNYYKIFKQLKSFKIIIVDTNFFLCFADRASQYIYVLLTAHLSIFMFCWPRISVYLCFADRASKYVYVLLTVHLSIFILVINQLDAQNFVLQ